MLILKSPWENQPQTPININKSSSLAEGMFVSIENGMYFAKENIYPATNTGSTLAPLIPTILGMGFNTAGSTYDRRVLMDGPLAATAPWTIGVTLISFAYVNLSHFFGFGLNSTGGVIQTIGITNGAFRGILSTNSNYYFWGKSADWDTGVPVDTDGAVHTIMFVCNGTTLFFYRDGVLRAQVARPALTDTTTGQYVVLGCRHPSGASSPNARIISGRAWDRALTPQEAAQYPQKQWEIYTPLSQNIPISITSGGAYTLNLETGVYSFSGTDATLTKDAKLTLDSGTYTLSGSNASLLKGLILEASSGSYSISGSDASLFYTHLLNASSGSYAITGSDATLTYTPTAGAYTLNAESGAYVLLGQDVTFVYSGSEVTLKAGSWIRYRIIT